MARSEKMNLKVLVAILVLAFAGTAVAAAQRRPGSLRGAISGRSVPTIQQPSARTPQVTVVEVEKDDTVYTTSTETVRSWQRPLGSVSEEMARTLPWTARLTNMNKAGHYGRVEILGPDLTPTTYEFTLNIIAMAADSLRKDEYRTVKASRLDYISDADGTDVVQERMYDANNNLLMYVVSMPLVGNGDIKALGEFYFGPDGLPLALVKTPSGMSGDVRVVHFHLPDSTTVSGLFVGTEQIPMENGEYFIQYRFSPDHRRHGEISLDKNLKPIINKKGYSMEMTYRGADMNTDSIVYFGVDARPMVIGKESTDSTLIGVSKRVFRFDGMEQVREERFFGLNNEPVENAYGVHVQLYDTNDRNQRVAARALALDGSPASYDGTGASWWTARYDSIGRILEYHQYDTQGRPAGNLSSFVNAFLPDGRCSIIRNYVAEDGLEKLVYGYEIADGVAHTVNADGSTELEIYDRKGRITRKELRDSLGCLRETGDAFPIAEWIYTDRPDGTVVTSRRLYDNMGRLKEESLVDSAALTRMWTAYDSLERVVDRNLQKYSADWSTPVFQASVDAAGRLVRSSFRSQPLSYNVLIDHTLRGEYYNFRAVDEFGEPDFMVYPDGSVAAFNIANSDHNQGFEPRDANGDIITDMEEFKARTPKYMSVEVAASTALALGLRDNDIILKYGSWEPSPVEIISPDSYLAGWTKAAVSEASRPKEVVVFRIDSVEPERYGLYRMELPAGTTRDLGFLTHLTYKTPKQMDRIFAAMVRGGFKMPALSSDAAGHSAIAAFPQMRSDFRVSDYALEVGAPSLLCYAYCEEYPHLSWKAGEDAEKATNLIGLIGPGVASGLHLRAYFFDGREMKPLTLHAGNSDNLLRLVETSVADGQLVDMLAAMPPVGAVKRSPVHDQYAAAGALFHNRFYKEALPLLKAEAEAGNADAATYAALMHFIGRGTKKSAKKAMYFSELALKDLPEDAIMTRAQMIALSNRKDAVRYIADALTEYKMGEKTRQEVYNELRELKKFVEQLASYAPEDVDHALVHMAVLANSIGLRAPYIVKEFLLGPIRHDRLVTHHGDFSSYAYSFMFDSAADSPEIKHLYDEYMASHVPVFTITESPDSPAYARGMRGAYIIVRMNDWNMYSDFNWVDYNQQLKAMPKRVLLIAPDGSVVEEAFDDRIGARFVMRKADAATRERVKQLIIESSEDETIHPD